MGASSGTPPSPNTAAAPAPRPSPAPALPAPPRRLAFLHAACVVFRLQLYVHWGLAEAGALLSGAGYSGPDGRCVPAPPAGRRSRLPGCCCLRQAWSACSGFGGGVPWKMHCCVRPFRGGHAWERARCVRMSEVELGQSLAGVVMHWNIPVATFMRRCEPGGSWPGAKPGRCLEALGAQPGVPTQQPFEQPKCHALSGPAAACPGPWRLWRVCGSHPACARCVPVPSSFHRRVRPAAARQRPQPAGRPGGHVPGQRAVARPAGRLPAGRSRVWWVHSGAASWAAFEGPGASLLLSRWPLGF